MNRFPDNKAFAFTIFDDTDLSTVENTAPMYRLLEELGMRTTKSVWPLACVPNSPCFGFSLQDNEYLTFILELQEKGFEIALHNMRNTHSTRDEIEHGLEEFRRLIGHYPRVHTNHSSNRDNLYWGTARFSTSIAVLYRVSESVRRGRTFEGHLSGSPYFWGDICRQRIEYVRNFVFRELNLERINPKMPYHDERRPYVQAWFSSADGANVIRFCELLKESNQDRLEAECGFSIVYTHLASGFVSEGKVDTRAAALLRRLASKNGWFVPVSQLLDWLRQRRATLSILPKEISRMEHWWLANRIRGALTSTLGDS